MFLKMMIPVFMALGFMGIASNPDKQEEGNYKSQIPNKFQITMSKVKIKKQLNPPRGKPRGMRSLSRFNC